MLIESSTAVTGRLRQRTLLLCLAFGSLASTLLAQQPAPNTPPPPAPTLKVSVRRVVVDITVTDSSGQPVRGLTADDFRLTEDGTAETLRSFDVHIAESQPPVPLPALPPNTFSNLSSTPSNGPATVILYDLLNTPLDAQPYAHAQLLDFLRQRKASGQVAIFVLTDKLHMLQGFTDDDNLLLAALNQKKGVRYRSGLLQSQGEADAPNSQLTRTEGNQNGADASPDASFQAIAGMLSNMETIEQSYLLDQRVTLTADALQQIAHFLVAMPGRKNLLWLSGSFPTGIIPNGDANGRDPVTGQNVFSTDRNFSAGIVEATDMLNLAHVAVYPIDARCLQTNPMFSSSSAQTFEPGTGKDLRAVRDFATNQASEHATMDVIAAQTGGLAFYNTNGLRQAAAQALQQASVYYTVTYTPGNHTYNGSLRKVRVELTHPVPGYRLAYRRSYFARDLDTAAKVQQQTATDPLLVTLEHGAPGDHDLFFEVHVTPAGQPALATPEQMQQLVKYEAMFSTSKRRIGQELAKPILLQPYVIQYVLLPRQLEIHTAPDGLKHDDLEFAAVAYTRDGLVMNGTRVRIQDVIRPVRWVEIQEGGYHVPLNVLVPAEANSLRLAVRDVAGNKTGSLELSLPLPPEQMP